jgi:hypothetical protein
MNPTTIEIKKDDALICRNNKPLTGNLVAPPLNENDSYTAKDVITCVCGSKHVDVGLVSDYNYVSCFECKEPLPDGDKIHWCHPSRFEILQQ